MVLPGQGSFCDRSQSDVIGLRHLMVSSEAWYKCLTAAFRKEIFAKQGKEIQEQQQHPIKTFKKISKHGANHGF